MEVMIPTPAVDFNFDSGCTSPYMSSPSSPQPFGNFFFSASSFRGGGGHSTVSGGSPSTISFNWEEKTGIPKTKGSTRDDNVFEFDFSGQLEITSLSADVLFDGGKIKPLKPPPRLQFSDNELNDSPKSPRSPIGKKIFRESLSPRHKKKDFDPLAAAIEQTNPQEHINECKQVREQGRERTYNSSASSLRQKGTRSLSPPFRVGDIFFESESDLQSWNSSTSTKTKHSNSTSSWKGHQKWRLKNFLLFRSASEGRATSKDAFKYSSLKKSTVDVKNSSFMSTERGGSASSRRGGPVSAHEMLYTANRAATEEMKKKTFLP